MFFLSMCNVFYFNGLIRRRALLLDSSYSALETNVAVDEVEEAEKEMSRLVLPNLFKCLDELGKSGFAKVTNFVEEGAFLAEDMHMTSVAIRMSNRVMFLPGVLEDDAKLVAVKGIVVMLLSLL